MVWPRVKELWDRFQDSAALLNRLDSNEGNRKLLVAIAGQAKEIHRLLGEIRDSLAAARYPFPHAGDETSIADHAIPVVPPPDEWGQLMTAADELGQKIFSLYYRLMGHLAVLAQAVEQVVGLSPLPLPPEDGAPTEEAVAAAR
jgi:hypothetical protein